MLEVRVPRLVGRSRAAPGDEGAGLSRYANVGRREHRQKGWWQRAARSPVLKANHGARVGILLDEACFGLICDNPACVIALESEPRDVSAPIVMSFDAHAVSLPRAPQRHDPRGEIIIAVRMAVRHDEAPDPDRPVSGAGVRAPLTMVLEHGGLDIDAGEAKESRLGKGMLRPNDQTRSRGHLRTLRRPSDVAAAKQPIMELGDDYRTLIPERYHLGMSKQIAVRLPDALIEFVDDVVASGHGRSRAAVVTRALERERRRAVAARDAAILAQTGRDPELEGLAEHAADLPHDDA